MVDTAVILAAGLGSRLKKHNQAKPKGFLEINGVPIIERSIKILKKNGIETIVIGTGFKNEFYEALADKFSHIVCVKNSEFAETGSFYTLYNLRTAVRGDFLLLESDLYYEERSIRVLQGLDKSDVILASGRTNSGDEVYIQTDDRGRLVNMSKKAEELGRISAELVGISRISKSLFDRICDWAGHNDIKKREYESVLVEMAGVHPIHVEKVEDLLWAEIDNLDHLERTVKLILPRIAEKEHERAD
jgi:2-aminoethylphosphonate-pyruvate transaminase